ncbi:MAG: AmmeMemoRadiSam system protein B [Sphaerochaetaceae bacterium]
MSILSSHHHGIFYPEEREQLSVATQKRETESYSKSLPAAILVPHAAYRYVLDALHRGFSVAGKRNPSLIVFLGPLHQEVLEADEPAFLFTSMQDGINIAGRTHQFAASLLTELIKTYAPFLKREDSYLIEEPAFELTLPMIDSYFPGVPVLPLLAASCTSEQLKTYRKLLDDVCKREKQVLFIVSANANALLPSPQAEEDAKAFVSRLETGGSLFENRRGERISSCNAASLEALRQQRFLSGNWIVTGYYDKQGEHPTIEQSGNTKEKHVWHISAYQGDTDV